MPSDEDRRRRALELVRDWARNLRHESQTPFELIEAGPFEAYVFRDDPDGFSFAIPAQPAPPAAVRSGLDALATLSRSRTRPLQLEFSPDLWPTLSDQVGRGGWSQTGRRPLMACGPDELRPVTAPGVSVRLLAPDAPEEELALFQAIRFEDSDDPSVTTPSRLNDARAGVRAGHFALAELNGIAAGTAVLYPLGPTAEMVGVATLPALRRRGVAATACTWLCRFHFDRRGQLVFLDAEDDRATALYRKLGFVHLGDWLEYMPAESAPGRT